MQVWSRRSPGRARGPRYRPDSCPSRRYGRARKSPVSFGRSSTSRRRPSRSVPCICTPRRLATSAWSCSAIIRLPAASFARTRRRRINRRLAEISRVRSGILHVKSRSENTATFVCRSTRSLRARKDITFGESTRASPPALKGAQCNPAAAATGLSARASSGTTTKKWSALLPHVRRRGTGPSPASGSTVHRRGSHGPPLSTQFPERRHHMAAK